MWVPQTVITVEFLNVKLYESNKRVIFVKDFSLNLVNILYVAILYFAYVNLLTFLLTPFSRVLLEKLTGFQLVKKFPAFYGTRRFITTFTSAATCPYPMPARSSPYPHIPLPEDPS